MTAETIPTYEQLTARVAELEKCADHWDTTELESSIVAERDLFRALVVSAEEVLDHYLGTCEPDCECILHPLRAALQPRTEEQHLG